MMTRLFAVAVLIVTTAASGAEERERLLATAPSGAFCLRCKENSGAVWVGSRDDDLNRIKLPGVTVRMHEYGNWKSGLREERTDELDTHGAVPLPFISPDENWIFVQMNVESAFDIGLLYSRV